MQISDNLKQEILQSLQRKQKIYHNKVYQTKERIVDPTYSSKIKNIIHVITAIMAGNDTF